ncbi:MAG: tetratricopeptide repeat protein [Alphaproteobacteria bacterium]|nr:tetratricopeptide repeat protein [Alphaproteobacteria bacterium]
MNSGPAARSDHNRRMSMQEALKLAAAHQGAGRLPQAEAVLRQILQQRPNQPEALHLLAIVAHQAGKTNVGIELIARALAINPNVALFEANIAEMYRRVGDARAAISHGRRAVELNPQNADAHNNLGIAHYDLGDYAGAVESYDKAIAQRPRFAEAISNRGNGLRNLRRYDEAEAEYRRALSINPSYAEAYNNLGSVLRDLERPAEAVTAYKKAIAIAPNYVEARNNLILAHKDLQDYDAALSAGQDALRVKPQNAEALAYIGSIYVDQKKLDQGFDALRRSLALNPNKAEAHNMLGRAYFEANQSEKALECYRKAASLKPDFADPYNNIGMCLKELGRFDEALDALNRALAINPNLIGTYVNLVDAKKFESKDDQHLVALERFAAKIDTLPEERQQHLHFALAKAYDDLKRYDEAFPHLLKGNAIKRRTITYDEQTALNYFERVKSAIAAEVVRDKAGGGTATDLPIFVLGMPRSGTTLVEQIIASHPAVTGGGELKDMSDTVNSVRKRDGVQAPYPEFVVALTPQELAAFGESYARRLATRAPGALHITDKMPSNFYFLALIHLALPNAKVIHTNRNPVDTCLSCFSKLFAGEQLQTYDLAEVGRYYRAYHGLMEHWRAVLPPLAFLDVQYEEIVADLEGQARRILDYCGLEWNPRVLDFYKHERPVKTASASQVRKPIYGSSVARWRNYEKFLGPLLQELGPLVR